MVAGLDAVKVTNAKLVHGGVASGAASINPTFRDVTNVNNEQRNIVAVNEKNREEQRTSASRAGDGDPSINAFRAIDQGLSEIMREIPQMNSTGRLGKTTEINLELARLGIMSSVVGKSIKSRQEMSEALVRRLLGV